MASTASELRAHGFRLYVDGAEARLSETQCADTAGPDGYACSGRLPAMAPGRHVLELTALFNGQESTRSLPLTVLVVAASQAGLHAEPADGAGAGERGKEALGDEAGGEAGTATLAAGLGDVSWLTAAPDGRLFFVESGRAVRVVERDALLPDPAYVLDTPGGAIVGLAVDPRLQETGAVYVAWTEAGRGGARELAVTRFRELAGSLGEGATIVTGLPFPAEGLAPLAVDDHGLLYVAMPALDGARASADGAYNGFVLRFAADGGVPGGNPRSSPILAAGFAEPRALAVDGAASRVWLAGSHPAWRHSVAAFPLDARGDSAWPRLPAPALPRDTDGPGQAVSAMSLARPSGPAPVVLNLVSPRGALRASVGADGRVTATEALETGAYGDVSAVVTGAGGQSYAVVGRARGLTSIVRLATR